MSGHSKWATIKRAKGATDAKRGLLFTKLSKNISVAARRGKDPEFNATLRTMIEAAKAASMPKDNIEKAILRGAGELPGQKIEEVVYEGYGPNGIALMIRCATDNPNRTSSFLKSTLGKYDGHLGGPGSVSYIFKPIGLIRLEQTDETLQLQAMDAGATDVVEEDNGLTIYTKPNQLEQVKLSLGNVVITMSNITMQPTTEIAITDSVLQNKINTLLTELEDNEDVVEIHNNAQS